ncbi:MAG: hypothetical protein KGD59_11935 [Candidatus Heimdallarchaeota archaeon]|nr:hypothetical protein [Candidatus Heimdallarchaeota archaeon]MBY8995253.1 hypothetical protein [Candidatus Heimdallarchaeota archaeon]
MKRIKLKHKLTSSVFLLIIGFVFVSNFVASASDTTQEFTVNNETKILLDITEDVYYNGSISITVTTGDPVNATVNGVTKEISVSETEVLYILNTTSIFFSLSSDGLSEGYFEMELNYDPTANDNNNVRRLIGVAAAFILVISVITYYIRAKKLERKPDEEDEELLDPETIRKRREAAGAEKKFWGLDDIDQKKE